MRRSHETALTIAILLALGTSFPAVAGDAEPEMAESPGALEGVEKGAGPVLVDGMLMGKDAKTGEVRQPTAEEVARISARLQQLFGLKPPTPRVVAHENGMLSAELDESRLELMVVRKAPDGSLETTCVDGAGAALELFSSVPEEE